MCIFSRPVRHVANTHIFARLGPNDTQFLVYKMNFAANGELAMILPLPIQTPAAENSVQFIDLQKYSSFFGALDAGFHAPEFAGGRGGGGGGLSRPLAPAAPRLPVFPVGRFSASFVPTLADFGRLDAQFVLPPQVWAKARAYKDWGFAVFKLNNTGDQIQSPSYPMALAFRTRYTDRLFFPTLHIHDEQIHPTEIFDHDLYFQDARLPIEILRASTKPAAQFVDVQASQNIVDGKLFCCKREMRGRLANRDTFVHLA